MKKLIITMEFTLQDNDAIWMTENAPKYKDRIPNAYYLSKLQENAIEVKTEIGVSELK